MDNRQDPKNRKMSIDDLLNEDLDDFESYLNGMGKKSTGAPKSDRAQVSSSQKAPAVSSPERTPVTQEQDFVDYRPEDIRISARDHQNGQPIRLTAEERKRIEQQRRGETRGTAAQPAQVPRDSESPRQNRPAPRREISDAVPATVEEPVTAEPERRLSKREMKQLAEEQAEQEYYKALGNEPDKKKYLTKERKRKTRINVGLIIFLVIIAAVVTISLLHMKNNPMDPYQPEDTKSTVPDTTDTKDQVPDTQDSQDTEDTKDTEDTTPPAPAETGFEIEVPVTDISRGDLILVNYENPYSRTDEVVTVNVRDNRKGNIAVSALAISVRAEMLEAMEAAVADMTAQGFVDYLLVNSGYRNVEDQQAVWDRYMDQYGEEYTREYVNVPGYSEHHTGLCADLTFYTLEGATIPVSDHQFGAWLTEHCTDYGLILRYPAGKTDITHVAHEPWHFRYIGKVHAMIYKNLGMCFEEYLEYLKQFTADTKLLHVTAEGAVSETAAADLSADPEGYYVFYVPAGDSETTSIRIPFAEEKVTYEVSGNNRDGFIVTVSASK